MTKFTAAGPSAGVVNPKKMLARDPGFAVKMDKAEDIIRRYRNTLHVLAQ